MDPITLATITSGVTVLATEAGKGVLSEAGKDAWTKIKALFGWTADPKPEELAPAVATRLQDDEQAARTIVDLLRHAGPSATTAAAIVGQINAEKVAVINNQTVSGDFNLNL